MARGMKARACAADDAGRDTWDAWPGRVTIAITLAIALLAGNAGAALAFGDGTPDTDPPAEESVCDGLSGRAWGLCVAYCEAQDCPGSDHPSCEILRDKVFGVLGTDTFPCDGPGGIG